MNTASVTAEEVRQGYRVILGREVEADPIVEAYVASGRSQLDLLVDLLNSAEFAMTRGQRLKAWHMANVNDLSTVLAFSRYLGAGTPGFVTDFLGTRTRTAFVKTLAGLDGTVEGYPLPNGNWHGDIIEWMGTLSAVLAAKDRFTVVELGAGWAPWLAACAKAAAQRGITNLRLLGVEGSSAHVEFARLHLRENGIDPACWTMRHGIVAAVDGVAEFPIAADPSHDWGQAAFRDDREGAADGVRHDYRGFVIEQVERVNAYSIRSLLADLPEVDLMHVDIQGHEVECIASGLEMITDKVKSMVIGTHGRGLEQGLLALLPKAGWILRRDSACEMSLETNPPLLVKDGCQVWRNGRFFSS